MPSPPRPRLRRSIGHRPIATRRPVRLLVATLALVSPVGALPSPAAQRSAPGVLEGNGQVLVVTTDTYGTTPGSTVLVRGGPPWTREALRATNGGRFLRRFGKVSYVVDEDAGTITRTRVDGAPLPRLAVGTGSLPQDVFVRDATSAYVTRLQSSELLRFDLATGASVPVVDLAPFASPTETLEVRTMHPDGDRLFVQLGMTDTSGASRGALAVLDMRTETLVDADPLTPGVQAVALQGAPPHLKMQRRGRTLYVSATLHRLDDRGGIETVDLDGLRSTGLILTESEAFGADIGAFVMTSDDEGFFVYHTDIGSSTHLRHFSLAGGVNPGGDLLFFLGSVVDSLGYDRARQRLYLPTGFASPAGEGRLLVLDTRTRRPLRSTPVPTGRRAHDVIVLR